MFYSEYLSNLSRRTWLGFWSSLSFLLKFVFWFLLTAMPIIIYVCYPVIFEGYAYFSTTFFAWIFAGFSSMVLTILIYSVSGNFWKENEPVFFYQNCFFLIFWVLSFSLFTYTDNLYTNGKHLKLEQAGRCDLVHASDQESCNTRKYLLAENSGVFKIISGNLLSDRSCMLTLSEALHSGMSRTNSLHASMSFCEKLKVGDKVKLSSSLTESLSFCKGNTKKGYLPPDSFEKMAAMKIDVCTTYELLPS